MLGEDEAKKAYAEAGVDLPEVKDPPSEEHKDPEEEPAPEPEAPTEEPEAPKAPLHEPPKEPRKRSIYDDLKDERKTRKDAETRAEQAEQDRDALKAKLDAIGDAKPGEDRAEATEDAIAYAKKVGADPALVQRIIEDARKGLGVDPKLMERLERFEHWEKTNAPAIEKQMFDDEFKSSTPKLQKLFPGATPAEFEAIKTELDRISHTKDWHDKPLAFIAFEHQDTLAALVSPKKRGMESKDRKDSPEDTFEFDPNADYSKMSPKEKERWEAEYRKLGKSDGLLTDNQGRKTII